MSNQTYQGTWEEVLTHAAELSGKQVQVIVLSTESEKQTPPNGAISYKEIDRRMKALDVYFATAPNFPQTPLLSNADLSRESIYGER